MRSLIASLASLATLIVVGCQQSSPQQPPAATQSSPTDPAAPKPPSIPNDSEVRNIHLMSLGSSLGPQYDVTLTDGSDIEAMMGWLRRIDWSPSRAHSLEGVGLASVGKITLNKTDGSAQTFRLSGGIIIVDGWDWPADTKRLAEIARGADAVAPDAIREEEAARLLFRRERARIDGTEPPESWPEKVRRVGSAWVVDLDAGRRPGGYPEQIVIDITTTGGHSGNPKR